MLRHFRNHRTYWFCRHCWQEMPNLTVFLKNNYSQKYQSNKFSIGFKTVLKERKLHKFIK